MRGCSIGFSPHWKRCLLLCSVVVVLIHPAPVAAPPGSWPEPRQNAQLTGFQPMAGTMTEAPEPVARYDLGRGTATPTVTKIDSENVALCLVAGALFCYNQDGSTRWSSHPAGLNYETLVRLGDLDGDGKQEILLQAGRPTMPYAAAVLVDLETGALRWRYDVEPMSYGWYLYAGNYLPGRSDQQIFVVMMGYPPDPKNGYCTLFAFDEAGAPQAQWRYDFHEYTCFPTFHQTDLDGDAVEELVIQTHSRAWFLDAVTGAMKHFAKWDTSPANVRSYGYTRFVDLNSDGREDFLCIANFSQHHEVLLNNNGVMEEAWHQGWAESVTTGKVVTTWPEPPYADVDGDGDLEIILSMYNSEDENAWLTRVYDAVDGTLQYRFPGVIATRTGDVENDQVMEILANRSTDPTQSGTEGAVLLAVTDGQLSPRWEDPRATAQKSGMEVILGDKVLRQLRATEDGPHDVLPVPVLPTPPAAPGPDFSALPAQVGPKMPVLLAGDLTADGKQELLLYQGDTATVLQLSGDTLAVRGSYRSTSLPTLADFDGDGALDLALTTITPTSLPRVTVLTPSQNNRVVWETRFPEAGRSGLPQPRKAYTRSIHLTGKTTPDLYVWAGTPVVRSVGMDGLTGSILWEKGEVGNERYWGPSVNYAAAWDYNGDGTEDLIFTNPDYYCVADGPTGELLRGPDFPPTIFNQASQGLYTFPAVLARPSGLPDVCLVGGHYFQGGMSLAATPYWHAVPAPGENRAGHEAFLRAEDGSWWMGFGRQNGRFAWVDARDGSLRWDFEVQATCSDVISGDVDGDGQKEFVFGTSHGEVIALGDRDGAPWVRWRIQTGQSMGNPILADLDGDGAVELAVPQTDGWVSVFDLRH